VVEPVRLRTKLFAWLILGTLSVYFAEIASGSSPFAFFGAWGLYAVLPLYALHVVFLAFAAVRPGRRVRLTVLFCAGAVFGLYEAYITKVIWDPTWGDRGLAVGGVFLSQTAMLVLYWHPFMAFLVPLLAGELLLSSSSEVLDALPGPVRRALRAPWLFAAAVLTAAFVGVSKAANSPTPGHALLSVLAGAAVPALLVLLWKVLPGGTRRAGLALRDLLPDRRQGVVIGVLLAAYYVVTGVLIRPASLPRSIVPHLSVAALYAVFGGLAVAIAFRTPRGALPAPGERRGRARFAWAAAAFVATFAAISAALAPAKEAAGALSLIAGLVGMAAGSALTAAALVAAVRRT
jgi:hypothetical protein